MLTDFLMSANMTINKAKMPVMTLQEGKTVSLFVLRRSFDLGFGKLIMASKYNLEFSD